MVIRNSSTRPEMSAKVIQRTPTFAPAPAIRKFLCKGKKERTGATGGASCLSEEACECLSKKNHLACLPHQVTIAGILG